MLKLCIQNGSEIFFEMYSLTLFNLVSKQTELMFIINYWKSNTNNYSDSYLLHISDNQVHKRMHTHTHTHTPVSYTHLDVYKRQVIYYIYEYG